MGPEPYPGHNKEIRYMQQQDRITELEAEVERLKEEKTKWTIATNREKIMQQWDKWREYIASGGTASWPRDAFESVLDRIEELEKALRSMGGILRAVSYIEQI